MKKIGEFYRIEAECIKNYSLDKFVSSDVFKGIKKSMLKMNNSDS